MRGSDGRLILASVIILVLLYHIWKGQGLLRSPHGYAPSHRQSLATSDTHAEAWRVGSKANHRHARIKVTVRTRQRSSEPGRVHVTVKPSAAGEAAAQAASDPAALMSVGRQLPQQTARQQAPIRQAPGISGGQGRKQLPGKIGHPHVQTITSQQVQRAQELQARVDSRGGIGSDLRARASAAQEPTEQQRAVGLQAGAVGTWSTAAVQHASQAPPTPQTSEMVRPWAGAAPLPPPGQTCEAWLAAADHVPGRDFAEQPITVLTAAGDETLEGCAVPCRMTTGQTNLTVEGGTAPAYDAHFGVSQIGAPAGLAVLRNMESVTNYQHLDTARAHAAGKHVVMTTHLDSDVPAGYLSWAGARCWRIVSFRSQALSEQGRT